MSGQRNVFDPIWDAIYQEGRQVNRCPFDSVVSFVFRNIPEGKPHRKIDILEVGCGAGNNLWFLAREGFRVAGVDMSAKAVELARERFRSERLKGELRRADFTSLPFRDERFDLVVDRAALTCCDLEAATRAVQEIRRVLKPYGRMLFNPYSSFHSSFAASRRGRFGLRREICAGSLVGVGGICFYGRSDIEKLFCNGWKILSIRHVVLVEMLEPAYTVDAEWRVVVEKE